MVSRAIRAMPRPDYFMVMGIVSCAMDAGMVVDDIVGDYVGHINKKYAGEYTGEFQIKTSADATVGVTDTVNKKMPQIQSIDLTSYK